MVLLGGLEIVAGGYLIHRHQKKKKEKKKLEDEARERRHHTFPGPRPQIIPPQQQAMIPQQKVAYYAPQPQPHFQPRPHTAQTFPQNRPYPPHSQSHPQPTLPYYQQIQPLQRTDSFATLSNMPVANGGRPQDGQPALPSQPRPWASQLNTQPNTQQQSLNLPYNNIGFSASVPSFGPSSTSPHTHTTSPSLGRHTVDDNWETYGSLSPHVRFDVSNSPQPGERDEENDPPPPYRP